MIKLIVTDLDGTLLADDKSLSPEFWDMEKQLRERGIIFALASGRPYYNMVSVFEKIKDHVYFISDNGAFAVFQSQAFLVDPLSDNYLKEFIEISRNIPQSYPILCAKEQAYMEDDNEKMLEQALKYYQHYKIVDDLTKISAPILKMSMCDLKNAEENTYPQYTKYKENYNVVVSGKVWVDITSKTANKGNAIKKLQERIGVGFEETLVFGDYLNDVEMMYTAKYSYAMKNAQQEVIEAAKYVTTYDNNNSGVLNIIRDLCLR